MNKIKYLSELSLTPVYFLLALAFGIVRAFKDAALDTLDAIRSTNWKYGIGKKD